MPHQFLFYADPEAVQVDEIIFDRRESHHISDVLRTAAGATIEVTDGLGWIYRVKLTSAEKGRWAGQILEKRQAEAGAPLPISLALPCLKGDRWENALEAACEMGLSAVWLMDFAQASLSWSKARRERAERKAIEALKQSGGSRLTLIQGPCGLEELLRQSNAGEIWTAEASGEPLPDLRAPILLIIGPEAGLGAAERELLKVKQSRLFSLGSRRLRAEVAAVAAISQAALRLIAIE